MTHIVGSVDVTKRHWIFRYIFATIHESFVTGRTLLNVQLDIKTFLRLPLSPRLSYKLTWKMQLYSGSVCCYVSIRFALRFFLPLLSFTALDTTNVRLISYIIKHKTPSYHAILHYSSDNIALYYSTDKTSRFPLSNLN